MKVKFATVLPPGGGIVAEPIVKESVARSDDLFTIGFKVKNRTSREFVTRIVHRVEPKEMAPISICRMRPVAASTASSRRRADLQ